MEFTEDEINIFRQWFDALEDTNKGYLIAEDYALIVRVHTALGLPVRPSHSEKAKVK